jgi:hypothetical protein
MTAVLIHEAVEWFVIQQKLTDTEVSTKHYLRSTAVNGPAPTPPTEGK